MDKKIFFCRYWWLLILPDSIHKMNIMKPNTWLVPKTYMSTVSNSETSNVERQDGEKSLVSSEQVKQRMLSFKEMLLTTTVSYEDFITRIEKIFNLWYNFGNFSRCSFFFF